MAITTDAMNTALGGGVGNPRVMREYPIVSTFQEWLIDGGATYPGRVRHVRTTAADNAATQAATVVTALLAGGA